MPLARLDTHLIFNATSQSDGPKFHRIIYYDIRSLPY